MFMNEVYDVYMKQRLLDVSLGRKKGIAPIESSISKDDIIRSDIDESQFLVKSQSEEGQQYTVDLTTGICDCNVGMTGKVCKHQLACAEHFLLQLPQVFRDSPENRQWLAGIVLGKENLPSRDFFDTLEKCSEISNDTQHKGYEISPGAPSDKDTEVEAPPTNIVNEKNNEPTKPSEAVVEKITAIHDTLLHLATRFEDQQTLEGMEKLLSRLNSVRTSNQLNSLLHCTGSVSMHGAGRGKIPCQPTSVARRSDGMPRGAAPIGKGRKRKGCHIDKAMKRERNLALNISLNQPNAKSHGSGH